MKENKSTILTPDIIASLKEHERKDHIIQLLKNVPLSIEENTSLSNVLSSFVVLELRYKKIRAVGAKGLATALEKNNTITTIDLSDNYIGAAGAKYIATALEKNNTITTLELYGNNIGAAGAKDLATALEKNNTITTLDLDSNYIGDAGIKDLAKVLEKNNTITTINLSSNDIGVVDARDLAMALEKNNTITTLKLSSNNIGAAGAKYIATALGKNNTITTLDLSGNDIGDIGAKYIATALKKNNTITTINVGYNHIRAAGTKDLARALKKNNTITTLNLFCNNIGAAGAKYIATALEKNNTITRLDLGGNIIIGDADEKNIEDALCVNRRCKNMVSNLFNLSLALLTMDIIPPEVKSKILYGSPQYQKLHCYIDKHFTYNDNNGFNSNIHNANNGLYASYKATLLKPLVTGLEEEKTSQDVFEALLRGNSTLHNDIPKIKKFLPEKAQVTIDTMFTCTQTSDLKRKREDLVSNEAEPPNKRKKLDSIIQSVEKSVACTQPTCYTEKIEHTRNQSPTRER